MDKKLLAHIGGVAVFRSKIEVLPKKKEILTRSKRSDQDTYCQKLYFGNRFETKDFIK